MQIYLLKNGQQVGPYTVEVIRGMLSTRHIALTNQAWHEGLTDWQPLNTFLPSPPKPTAPFPVYAPQRPVQINLNQGPRTVTRGSTSAGSNYSSPITHYRADQPEQSTAVTALSVISLVFGIIGMLASFIPCFGAFALFIAIPAAIAGGAAFFIASSKKTPKGLAVSALTISLIGVVISGFQYMALAGAIKATKDAAQEEARSRRQLQQKQR